TFEWHSEGLRFTLSIPLGEKTKSSESETKHYRTSEDTHHAPHARMVAGNRLLLVEDEALVGMMMSDTLTQLGFHVLGPFGKIADALAAARREDFQAAILDINVDGELAYPV